MDTVSTWYFIQHMKLCAQTVQVPVVRGRMSHAMPCLPACLPACVSLDLLLDGGTCPGSRLHIFQHQYTASMAGSTPVHSLKVQ